MRQPCDVLIDYPVAVYGGGFSVKKGETSLLSTLSQGVSAALNTGMAEKALKKYDPEGALFLPVATPWRKP